MTHQSAYQLDVDVSRVGAAAVVTVCGSAGMNEADLLQGLLAGLTEEEGHLVVLDLAGLEFICSAGLGALVSAHLNSRDHGGQIRLVRPQDRIRGILEATRLDTLFRIFGDLDEAVTA
jgi:anti-sigma B factor antagonist